MLQTRLDDRIVISNIGIGYRDLQISIRPASETSRQPALFLGPDRIAPIPTPVSFDDLSPRLVVELFGRVAPALQRDIQSRINLDAEREARYATGDQ